MSIGGFGTQGIAVYCFSVLSTVLINDSRIFPGSLDHEIPRHEAGLLLLHLADHLLHVLRHAEDMVVPLADGLGILEPDAPVDLVDLAGQAALLYHLGGGVLGLLPVQAQQHAQGVEVDVGVQVGGGEEVVLDHGAGQDGGAVGGGGELVRLQALGELVDLGGVDEPVEEHLLQHGELVQAGGALVLVQPAQGAGPQGARGRQDGALDGHGQGVQPLLLGDGAAEADLVVGLAGGEELALGVVDAGLGELEVQLDGGVLDVEDDVLHLVEVRLGGGGVVDLEVVAHDADPHAGLVLVADAPLAALERDLGQHARRLGEVLVGLVAIGDQLPDLGGLLEEGGGLGRGRVEDVEGVGADLDPEVVVLPVAEGADEACEEGARVHDAEGLGEGLVGYCGEVGG